MKKYSLFIILIILIVLVFSFFLYFRGNAENKDISPTHNKDVKKVIDIENTVVECKNGERYPGKDLIDKGINFRLIESRIFYKGEELERLCNPSLGEYSYEAQPSFRIIPVY